MKPKILNKMKTYVIDPILLVLILTGFSYAKSFRKSSIVQKTIQAQIEDVKHIKHLELVTYYFESLVDVVHMDRSDKVYLHMIIPARVCSYIDLEQMNYRIEDALVTIYLPEPYPSY